MHKTEELRLWGDYTSLKTKIQPKYLNFKMELCGFPFVSKTLHCLRLIYIAFTESAVRLPGTDNKINAQELFPEFRVDRSISGESIQTIHFHHHLLLAKYG